MTHHGHIAFVLVIGALGIRLVGDNFRGINIKGNAFTSMLCGLRYNIQTQDASKR